MLWCSLYNDECIGQFCSACQGDITKCTNISEVPAHLEEVAKHRKKSNKKAPPKSKHEHIYEIILVEYVWNTMHKLETNDRWVWGKEKCIICGKERHFDKHMPLEEVAKYPRKEK